MCVSVCDVSVCACVSIRICFFVFSSSIIFACRAASVLACADIVLFFKARSRSNWSLARRVLACCWFSSRSIFRTSHNSSSSSPQITFITSRFFSKSDMDVALAAAVLARSCISTTAAASVFSRLVSTSNSRLLHINTC